MNVSFLFIQNILYGHKDVNNRAVGSNFQLVRPRYCDHNKAACNRQGVGVGGGCSPFRAKHKL